MYRINELFLSLQGEGFHTGRPAVFIRFSGCNLRCPFCDTEFASYTEMTKEDIVRRVQELSEDRRVLIVLTGGEPTLQVDEALTRELHATGKTITIETNGTHPIPAGIDWVTCSPKEASQVCLSKANEVKVVFLGQDVERWYEAIHAEHYYLQPCSCSNTQEVVGYLIHHPWWRLSLQTHKYLNIQ